MLLVVVAMECYASPADIILRISNPEGPRFHGQIGSEKRIVMKYGAAGGFLQTMYYYPHHWAGTVKGEKMVYKAYLWRDATGTWYFNLYGTNWHIGGKPFMTTNVFVDADGLPMASGTFSETPVTWHYGTTKWRVGSNL